MRRLVQDKISHENICFQEINEDQINMYTDQRWNHNDENVKSSPTHVQCSAVQCSASLFPLKSALLQPTGHRPWHHPSSNDGCSPVSQSIDRESQPSRYSHHHTPCICIQTPRYQHKFTFHARCSRLLNKSQVRQCNMHSSQASRCLWQKDPWFHIAAFTDLAEHLDYHLERSPRIPQRNQAATDFFCLRPSF